MNPFKFLGITILLCCGPVAADGQEAIDPSRPLVLAHYMPWFEAKPESNFYGWHWTMNHFDPNQTVAGGAEIATHYRPILGAYDSADPKVLAQHIEWMRAAGIGGVIIDWYGLEDFRDHKVLHERTCAMIERIDRAGMKFAICYEDRIINALVKAKRVEPADRVSHAAKELHWMRQNWFGKKSYVKYEGKPLLLSFGLDGLSNEEWSKLLAEVDFPVAYVSEHIKRDAAIGAYDWPVPQAGLRAVDRFYEQSQHWKLAIPVVFPRFHDIYSEAKLHPSYGKIEDREGVTFRELLRRALASGQPFIQIATWNDWGEGTQVEPSLEFGKRDLETIKELLVP